MQRVFETTSTSNEAPLYDSEAVRRVLTRATEIEAETERLTARQVEALGSELGLSPDAVRRALGETTGRNTDVALAPQARYRQTQPLTRAVLQSAYLPSVWFAVMQIPLAFIGSRSIDTGAISGETMIAYILYIYLPLLFCLAIRSGFLVKRAGVGIAGAWVATASTLAISCLSGYLGAINPPSVESMLMTNLVFSVLGVFGGALGVGARYIWDRISRNPNR